MNTEIAHRIKHRQYANDEFMTPPDLAIRLISLIPLKERDTVIDPCPGEGAFYNNLPPWVFKSQIIRDFFQCSADFDWIVGNPPYSQLEHWLEHSFILSNKGVAYLLGLHNITPRRLELANRYGFGLTRIYLCKVFHWFGISAFCIWEKGLPDIIQYGRTVWR